LSRLRRALALTFPEWQVLVAALVLLPWVSLRLRFTGLSRAAGKSGPGTARSAPPGPRIAQLVVAAARLGGYTCLPRALVVQRILRDRGFAPELRIGVRKAGGALDAHAWVELDGQALMETPDRDYVAFEPLGETGR